MTDTELLQAYRKSKDERLLGKLLDRYTLLLFGVCMKYLKNEEPAKDAVQQVFAKAIEELRKYDVVYVKSWLFMIAKNHCLMQLRSTKYNTLPIENDIGDDYDEWQVKIELQQKDKLIDLLHEGLLQLNHQQKQCIDAFYLRKKSYKEIADAEGITLMQVKSAIQNGKRNIRNWIESVLQKS